MNDFIVIKFQEAKQPYFKEKRGEGNGYIQFGEDNMYPNYLLDLFNKSAKHGAIVRNKVKYITGNGFTTESGNDSEFLKKFNVNKLTKKVALDLETFGGSYLEIIWSKLGRKIASIKHVDYTKIRTNSDNTQFWYKDTWDISDRKSRGQADVIPGFDPENVRQFKQILYVKEYRPGGYAYALPQYISALNFIESDIEVSKHILGNAANGFKPTKLVTLTNGEPSDDEKKEVTKKIEKKWGGSDGSSFIIEFVTDPSRRTLIEDLGVSALTKEDFTAVDVLIQNNIFAGHEITSPSLFGIAQPGKLGGSTELKDAYDIFKNTYANDKQIFIEDLFNTLGSYAGSTEKLKIMPINPLGIQFTFSDLSQFAPKAYLDEITGIDRNKYEQESQLEPGTTNEALRSLTGKQHQQLLRVIRQVGQGKLTREAAKVMLKNALGLSEQDIDTMLGIDEMPVQMSSQDAISIFQQFGEDKSNFEVLRSRQRFNDDEVELFADVTQTESNVLDLISKDKRITPEVIADTLKITVDRVNSILNSAISKGLISVKETAEGTGDMRNVIIERKLTQPLSKIVEQIKPQTTEFLIRYSYEWLPEVPASQRDTPAHPSRDFCRELMRLNKIYSRSDIEQISSRLGYSVWDRRGGWWNDNGDIKEHCRHRWFSQIVTRKK